MPAYRKEVTGTAANLEGDFDATPQGGTQKGPGKSGAVNGKKYLKEARGYIDDAAKAHGGPVGAKQPAGTVSKGPDEGTAGTKGLSKSGDGNGRFGKQDQKLTHASGSLMPNRVK
jgi:hypothetical protein